MSAASPVLVLAGLLLSGCGPGPTAPGPTITPEPAASAAISELAPGPAPQVETPTAEALFARHVDAIGGEAAIRAHKTLTVSGRVLLPDQGITATLLEHHEGTRGYQMRTEYPGLGVYASGYLDGVAWAMDPQVGPRLREGAAALEAARLADLYAVVHWDTRFPERRVVGRARFAEHETWELRAVSPEGKEVLHYFDVGSGLLRGLSARVADETGAVASRTVFHDYRPSGGVLTASWTEEWVGGVRSEVHLDAIDFDRADFPKLMLPPHILRLRSAPSAGR